MKHLPAISKLRIFNALLLWGALVSILWSVYFAIVIISMPYQIEFREGAAQVLTGYFLKRENPFVLENQPLTMNNYGLGYSLAVLPLAALFGNTLTLHRLVSFAFIIFSGMLGFWVVYKKDRDIPASLACSAFILIALIAHGGVGAFPSAMGCFLFLAAVLLPFLCSFDNFSLLISVLIVILAFYTKPYFLLAFGIVNSYLFLFVSKRKGVLYGAFCLLVFVLFFTVVHYLFPLYFIDTLVGNTSNATMTIAHLNIQLVVLLFFFFPVLVLYVLTGGFHVFNKDNQGVQRDQNPCISVDFLNWQLPVINQPFDFLIYFLLCSLIAFIFILGPHNGSFMNYAYQLLVPSFFFHFFRSTAGGEKTRPLLSIVVLLNLITLTWQVESPQMLSQKKSVEWARVFEYIHDSPVTLNSPAVASELSAQGKTPPDSGQTSYYYEVQPFHKNFITGTNYETFYNQGLDYISRMDQMIKTQKFDLVITTREKNSFYDEDLLKIYYYPADRIKLDMPQTGQLWNVIIWKPR